MYSYIFTVQRSISANSHEYRVVFTYSEENGRSIHLRSSRKDILGDWGSGFPSSWRRPLHLTVSCVRSFTKREALFYLAGRDFEFFFIFMGVDNGAQFFFCICFCRCHESCICPSMVEGISVSFPCGRMRCTGEFFFVQHVQYYLCTVMSKCGSSCLFDVDMRYYIQRVPSQTLWVVCFRIESLQVTLLLGHQTSEEPTHVNYS